MHFEILVEDQSGMKLVEILFRNIIGDAHSLRMHSYKGIGRVPKNLTATTDASRRMLLEQLPRLLAGYGRAYHNVPGVAVIIVCDLDSRCLKSFRAELDRILNACRPKPKTRFCIAVEECEAWLLGDLPALRTSYPRAKDGVLKAYQNDCVCGTWECLADAIYPGGSRALAAKGWQAVGAQKMTWAEKIGPRVNIEENMSPSFRYFRDTVRSLI